MSWSRRETLIGVATASAIGLSGCLGDDDDATPTIEQGFQPISIETHEPDPEAEVAVEVVPNNGFTEDRPASVTISFTNLAEGSRHFSGAANSPPFGGEDDAYATNDDGNSTLVLIPVELKAFSEGQRYHLRILDPEGGPFDNLGFPGSPTDECWRLDGEVDGLSAGVPPPEYFTLAPEETIKGEYEIYATYDSDGCLEPGTYRWDETIPTTGALVEFGFTLTLD